jgi:hypothetical protein
MVEIFSIITFLLIFQKEVIFIISTLLVNF